jgi:hypothetical protein
MLGLLADLLLQGNHLDLLLLEELDLTVLLSLMITVVAFVWVESSIKEELSQCV